MGPFERMVEKASEDDPWKVQSAYAFIGDYQTPHPAHVVDSKKESVWAFYIQFPSDRGAEGAVKILQRTPEIGTAIGEPHHYKKYGTGEDKVRPGSLLRVTVDAADRGEALKILKQAIVPWVLLKDLRGHGTVYEAVQSEFSAKVESEYREFRRYVESGRLDEFSLPAFLKDKLEFIKGLAAATGKNLTALLKVFSHRSVFAFFVKIGWSLANLWEFLKRGFKLYEGLLSAVAEFVANSPAGKWTEARLMELDAFLLKHPKVKTAAGPAVAGLLVYIWLNMTFTGNFVYDFDFSVVILALTGKYSLSKLFAGKDGHKMLLLLATGVLGLTFPWPGPTSAKFTTAVVVGLLKLKGGSVA